LTHVRLALVPPRRPPPSSWWPTTQMPARSFLWSKDRVSLHRRSTDTN